MSDASYLRFSRRTLLRLSGLGIGALAVGRCASVPSSSERSLASVFPDYGPIDRTFGDKKERKFGGDSFERPHDVLWNKADYLRTRRLAEAGSIEKAPVVIVGGGMSGLFSAYLLKDLNPIVLELAPRFGGNSKAESWRGVDYSIGAAYLLEPEPSSKWGKLCGELGIADLCRAKRSEDPIAWNGKRLANFWDGETDPAQAKIFKKVHHYLHDVWDQKNGRFYPEIPLPESGSVLRKTLALDEISLRSHLQKIAGGKLPPHLDAMIDQYCWSTFDASSEEVGAAAGLNFLSAEFGTPWVPRGGNAAIAERLVERLEGALPAGHLRPGSLVVDVRVTGDKVTVAYEDAKGTLKRVEARAVVMACPKFIAKKLIDDLEPERLLAIDRVKYRSYLLANVLLKKALPPDVFDLFLGGSSPSDKDRATDVALANFAAKSPRGSVLTLYRPMPFDGARYRLLQSNAFDKCYGEFLAQIEGEVLPIFDTKPSEVVDIRLTRWGHAIPVSEKGRLADGTAASLRKPYRGRVFFVEQDNWMLPAIETSAHEALHFAPKIRKVTSTGSQGTSSSG